MKHCISCTRWKQRDDFARSQRSPDGHSNVCRKCTSDRRKRNAKPGHGQNRVLHLRKRYGLDENAYEEMLEKQDGCCGICGGPPDRKFAGREPVFALDHNHTTGETRDLLCFSCNTKLSAIEDEQFMLLARAYLARHGYSHTEDTI